MSKRTLVWCLLALFGCSSKGSSMTTTIVPAYLAGDQCHSYTSLETCGAETGCAWVTVVSAPCPSNTTCAPAGQCVTIDPCATHSDENSCEGDTADGCAWAAVTTLCPAGSNCGSDGFCYQPGSSGTGGGCACACPDYCIEGQPCPPCACDCPPPPLDNDAGPTTGGGGSGGGTCTCGCPACAPGEACSPCDCDCNPPPPVILDGGVSCGPGNGGGGEGGGGTCTCNCPTCPPGEVCPDVCACSCTGDAGVPMSTPGGGGHKEPANPCYSYAAQSTCVGDPGENCVWIPNTQPCMSGINCPTGSCAPNAATVIDAGVMPCICNCPACIITPDGGTCPPCDCNCTTTGCE